MTYPELIAKALKGRSVNRTAKDLGIPQKTLDQYTKGRLPDYRTAFLLAQEAQMEPGDVFKMLAEEEEKRVGVRKGPSPPKQEAAD
jgi:transcriptional regulator with XRE-family HTH domain